MGNDEITEVIKKPEDKPTHLPAWATVIVAIVSGLASSVPAYLKYREMKEEAAAEAAKNAAAVKSEADIGYQTLVKAVEKHEEHDAKQDVWISKIEGHVAAIEAALNGVTVYRERDSFRHHAPPPVHSLSDDNDGIADEPPAPEPPPPEREKSKATKLKFTKPLPAPIQVQQHQYIPQNLPDTLDKAVEAKVKK